MKRNACEPLAQSDSCYGFVTEFDRALVSQVETEARQELDEFAMANATMVIELAALYDAPHAVGMLKEAERVQVGLAIEVVVDETHVMVHEGGTLQEPGSGLERVTQLHRRQELKCGMRI